MSIFVATYVNTLFTKSVKKIATKVFKTKGEGVGVNDFLNNVKKCIIGTARHP